MIFNDNTPQVIKKLGENIKRLFSKKEGIDNPQDIVNIAKDSIKGKDFSSEEKKSIYDICQKANIKIHGYTQKTAKVKGVDVSNNHTIIGTYKDYIITLKFIGIKGFVKLAPMGIKIGYDKSTSDIPKNVAFDFISTLSPNVDKVKSTKHSLTISALSDSIDSGYPRLSHKYSNKYKVKKSLGGFSITLSTLKSVKESSPVAGAMHRQDYNPNAVYIVNYLKKNTFVRDIAVCRDKMSSIFVCDNGEPIHMSLTNFKEMADDIKVYKCLLDSSFDHIVRLSKTGLDFYKNMVGESLHESAVTKLYHLSKDNLDGKTLQPRVPSNFLVQNGYEDGKTKRVCFAKSIDGSLRGMSQNLKGVKLYVHIPEKDYNTYTPSTKEVPDSKITSEVWIKESVKLKCIGCIEVTGDKGEDGIPYKYGNNTAELYDWNWNWVEKYPIHELSITSDLFESDYRFTRVPSYIDELKSIEECIINSAPKSGIVHEIYCPIIPLVDLNVTESVVHYFRDIDGVFAQNINTLSRSASYKNVEDIPTTTINLLLHI